MAGDATSVGSIIAYLTLNRGDWSAGVADTERDADRLGRLSPSIRISTNTGDVIGQLALVDAATKKTGDSATAAGNSFKIGLIPALLAVAPAAVPIAAVAGGALLGLLPTAAAVTLGIKGISDEFKSGALAGTQYGADIQQLQTWFTQLKTTAASGLLAGMDTAVAQSGPLVKELNQDLGVTSAQFGSMAGNIIPALLTVLHQLSPLFTTIGTDLQKGAAELEHWATSSTGVSKFVAYVQAELPAVEGLFGNLITLISHLVTAAAPFGGVLLSEISLFVHALDAIPIGVLQQAIPVVIALYAAFKAYQGITAIVAAVNAAINAMRGPFASSAAAAQASSLATQAAAAEEAAGVAAAKSAEAAAAAEAAIEIAAAAEATGSVLAAGAAASAEAAVEFAAAMEAEAAAAVAASGEISAAAAAAADSVVAEGEVASAGWSAMLGPVGALAVGIGILAGAFLSNSHSAQEAAQAQDSYAQSVKTSTDALNSANIAQTNDNLARQHTLAALDSLHANNDLLTVSYGDLTGAVNGSSDQFAAFKAQVEPLTQGFSAQSVVAKKLLSDISTLRGGLADQIKTQQDLNNTTEQSIGISNDQAAASAKLYGLTGTQGVAAYLAAQQAAEKNTATTQAQTLAFQLENNAAGLVNQALQTLAGQSLNNAQAQTALDQAVLSVNQSLKQNGATVADNTAKGVANRQAIDGAASALRAKMVAEAQATGSTEKATAQYHTNAASLLEEIGKLEGTTSAAYKYAEQLLKTPPVVKTKADLESDAAEAKIRTLQTDIDRIKQNRVPGLQANSQAALDVIHSLQAQIDALHGKDIYITTHVSQVNSSGAAVGPGYATGGPITGPGPKGIDSIPLVGAPGEFMMSDTAVDKFGLPFMRALNAGRLQLPTLAPASQVTGQGQWAGAGANQVAGWQQAKQLVDEMRALRAETMGLRQDVHQAAAANASTVTTGFDDSLSKSDRRTHIMVATGAGKGTGLS